MNTPPLDRRAVSAPISETALNAHSLSPARVARNVVLVVLFAIVVVSGIFAFTAGPADFHGPSIDEFFPKAVLFAGTPFELNRVMLIRILVVVAIVLFLWLGSRRMKVVPSRGQVAFEFVLNFVRKSIVIDTMGEANGKRFMGLIMGIFFTVLGMNLTSTIPGLQIAASANVGLPLVLAVVAYVAFIYAGIKRYGLRYFKKELILSGVPVVLIPFLALLEFLSTFIVRPVTLILRLLMNMVAGHMLLVLCFSATQFFIVTLLFSGNALGLLGIGSFAFGIAFVALEIFVGALQAYVFSILTAIYLQMALADDH
jgi:F-type H+-transporting ATPase subunit a